MHTAVTARAFTSFMNQRRVAVQASARSRVARCFNAMAAMIKRLITAESPGFRRKSRRPAERFEARGVALPPVPPCNRNLVCALDG